MLARYPVSLLKNSYGLTKHKYVFVKILRKIRIAMVFVSKKRFVKKNLDEFVKSQKLKLRWLSKKAHIQGIDIFRERGHTFSMLSFRKISITQ